MDLCQSVSQFNDYFNRVELYYSSGFFNRVKFCVKKETVFYNVAHPVPSNAAFDVIDGLHRVYKTAEKALYILNTDGLDKQLLYVQTPVCSIRVTIR